MAPEQGGRPSASQVLDGLAEALVGVLLLVTALLYSSRLSDNFLAKSGVVLVLGSGAIAAWLAARLVSGRLELVRSRLYLPFGAYLAAQVLSLSLAQNRGRALEVVAQSAVHLLLFLTVLHLYRDGRRRQRLVGLILGLGLCISAIGVLQYFGEAVIDLPARYRGIPISTLGNPNFVAHYLDLILPLAAALAIVRRGRSWGHAALAVLVVTGFHLVLTESRGGWLSSVAGAGAVVAVCAPRRRWGSRLVLALVVVALLSPVVGFVLESIYVGDGQTLYDRAAQVAEQTVDRGRTAFEATDFSRTMRVLIWKDTAELIRANPWVGVGPGSFGLHLPASRSTVGHRAWKELMGQRENVAYHAHNEYLETWAESGILGAAALVWLLATALWGAWRGAAVVQAGRGGTVSGEAEASGGVAASSKVEDPSSAASAPPDAALVLGCAGSLTAAAVHAVFSFNLQDPVSGTHLWVLVGLAGAIAGGAAAPIRVDLARTGRRVAAALGTGILALGGAYLGVCILVGDAHYFRGLEHLSHGHPNRAILAFRQAVGWRGREFRHHHSLGKTALEVGRLAEAETALRRSLDLHPHSPQALRLLGRTLLARQAPEQAAETFSRAVRIEPLEVDNYMLLADALAAAGDCGGAIQARRQALAFRPEDARLMMSLGIAYRQAGQLEEAAAVLERARSLSPRDGVIAGNQGAIQLQLGSLVAAEENLRIALRLDAANRAVWRANLVKALMLQKRLTEALSEARRAAAEAPQDRAMEALVERLSQPAEGETDD